LPQFSINFLFFPSIKQSKAKELKKITFQFDLVIFLFIVSFQAKPQMGHETDLIFKSMEKMGFVIKT
jgi:hypothetical protein